MYASRIRKRKSARRTAVGFEPRTKTRYLHNEIVGRSDWGYKRKPLGEEDGPGGARRETCGYRGSAPTQT